MEFLNAHGSIEEAVVPKVNNVTKISMQFNADYGT
jgi:hypothetical protein